MKKPTSLGLAACLLALAAMNTSAEAKGKRAECAEYASEAVDQYEKNLRLRCNFDGPRWSNARGAHFAWCLISPRGAVSESETRRRMLKECASRHRRGRGRRNPEAKRAGCDTYAQLAKVQAEAARKYDCDLRGPEWNTNRRAHFRWCLTNKRAFMLDELRYRAVELQKCFNNLGDYDDDRWDRGYRRRRF